MNNFANIDRALLRSFVALVQERSVSKAALRIGISQPAMSSALARLRDLFRDPLLLRGRGVMTTTQRALELSSQVQEVLERLDKLMAGGATFDPATSTANFTVTAPGYVENTFIPALLARLRIEAPHVSLEVRSVNPDRINEWLESGEVDVRIGWVRDPVPSVRATVLIRDRFVCLIGQQHPGIGKRMTLEQYVQAPQVRARASLRSDFWRWADDALMEHQPRPRVTCIVQDYMATASIVAETDLIAIVPERLATRFAEQYSLRVVDPPFDLPNITITGYWHERTHLSPPHQWFRATLAETAGQMSAKPRAVSPARGGT